MSDGELYRLARDLEEFMQCNCDFEKWPPEKSTGHSWLCRIHKAATAKYRGEA